MALTLSRLAKLKECGISLMSFAFLFLYAPESDENAANESTQFRTVVTYSTLKSRPFFAKLGPKDWLSHLIHAWK